MKKITFLFSLFLLGVELLEAQSKIEVNLLSGTTQSYNVSETGKLYFNDSELIVNEGSNITVIPISNIRSVVFDEHTLSVVSLGKQNGAMLYPNPVANYVKIHKEGNEKLDIAIFNMQGQQVLQGQYDSDVAIDVSSLKQGVYVVKTDGINLKFLKK